jgi:hypothetical protein
VHAGFFQSRAQQPDFGVNQFSPMISIDIAAFTERDIGVTIGEE